jgi:hypothetical protein
MVRILRGEPSVNKPTPEEFAAFLADLTKLTKKHKLIIGGCGCCGSPFIVREKIANHGRYKAKSAQPEEMTNLTWDG